jgi:release factor glutamine methyltransferase
MTVLEVLTAATGYLDKHGVESPRLNAEHLLAHVLGKKRLDLYLEFDRPLSDAERAPLRDLIRKRGERIPLQHLLGTAEFFGRSFLCDGRALVPRPETEQLVELVKSKIQNPRSKILDVGTGSGIIAITLALELPEAEIFAIDISPAALALAAENAQRLGVADRIAFHEGDLLPESPTPLDVIVANLPYITSAEMADLQKEVSFDPANALDGGEDGLDLIRKLITQAPRLLAPQALIALEIGHDQAARVAEIFTQHGYQDASIAKDYQGVGRFVSAQR